MESPDLVREGRHEAVWLYGRGALPMGDVAEAWFDVEELKASRLQRARLLRGCAWGAAMSSGLWLAIAFIVL